MGPPRRRRRRLPTAPCPGSLLAFAASLALAAFGLASKQAAAWAGAGGPSTSRLHERQGPARRPSLVRRAAAAAAARAGASVVDAVVVEGEGAGAAGSAAAAPPPLSPTAELRAALLARVGGLDRGRLAGEGDAEEVERLAGELARLAEEAGRWRLSFPEDLPVLEGRWKLLYSSAFAGRGFSRGGSLGGLRPGPPLESPIAEVGDIFQLYRTNASCADTIVQLRPPRWLRDAGVLEQLPFVGSNPDTVITLTQQFDVAANDTLRFAFLEGQVDSNALEQLRPLKFPMTLLGLPPDTSRDGPVTDTLATTYCDGELRIGVGGRFGELRVFQRA